MLTYAFISSTGHHETTAVKETVYFYLLSFLVFYLSEVVQEACVKYFKKLNGKPTHHENHYHKEHHLHYALLQVSHHWVFCRNSDSCLIFSRNSVMWV